MVDAQELGESPGVGVGLLSGAHSVTEPSVSSGEKLLDERPVKELGGLVQAQTARRERRNRSFFFLFD